MTVLELLKLETHLIVLEENNATMFWDGEEWVVRHIHQFGRFDVVYRGTDEELAVAEFIRAM